MTLILYRFLCNFFLLSKKMYEPIRRRGYLIFKTYRFAKNCPLPMLHSHNNNYTNSDYTTIQINTNRTKSNKNTIIHPDSLTYEQPFIYDGTVTQKRTLVSLQSIPLKSLINPCFLASMRYKKMASRKHMRQT